MSSTRSFGCLRATGECYSFAFYENEVVRRMFNSMIWVFACEFIQLPQHVGFLKNHEEV